MATDIARPPCPEILPAPPDRRMINLRHVRTLRCSPQPKIPIQICRRFLPLWRTRPDQPVGFHGPRPVRTPIHMFHLTYRLPLDPLDARTIPQPPSPLHPTPPSHAPPPPPPGTY